MHANDPLAWPLRPVQIAKIAALEEAIAAAPQPAAFSLFSAPVGMILVDASRSAVTDMPIYNHGGVRIGLLDALATKRCQYGEIEPPKAKLAAFLDLVLCDEPPLSRVA